MNEQTRRFWGLSFLANMPVFYLSIFLIFLGVCLLLSVLLTSSLLLWDGRIFSLGLALLVGLIIAALVKALVQIDRATQAQLIT